MNKKQRTKLLTKREKMISLAIKKNMPALIKVRDGFMNLTQRIKNMK